MVQIVIDGIVDLPLHHHKVHRVHKVHQVLLDRQGKYF